MDFFIRQHATSPLLVMKVIKDGRNDFHQLQEMLDNSCIIFSMLNLDCNAYKIAHKNGGYVKVETIHPDAPEEFVIFYRWVLGDTDTPGRYKGEFKIRLFDTGEELIVPIREDLFINILPSFVKNTHCAPTPDPTEPMRDQSCIFILPE